MTKPEKDKPAKPVKPAKPEKERDMSLPTPEEVERIEPDIKEELEKLAESLRRPWEPFEVEFGREYWPSDYFSSLELEMLTKELEASKWEVILDDFSRVTQYGFFRIRPLKG